VLGREINMSLLSQLDINSRQAFSNGAGSEVNYYYEEEDPLRLVSTTALEQRLKDLDEQKRVIEALQQLRTVQFDLTAESPMLQDSSEPRQTEQRTRDGDPNEAAGEGSSSVEEEEVHEFQRLAHTLKLARSLSLKFEVNADVECSYLMIADLETYPLWMPWCASGLIPGEKQPLSSYPAGKESSFIGDVGFGFETGTFLGTVGDTVHYTVTIVPPAPSGKDATVEIARCTADAENGFTYGERLVYDWRFTEIGENKTKVELDMLFQARSVIYMPIWDSMQNMVVNNMLAAFIARAEMLQQEKGEQASSHTSNADVL